MAMNTEIAVLWFVVACSLGVVHQRFSLIKMYERTLRGRGEHCTRKVEK